MPYIRVDTNKLKNYSSEIASLESRVRNIKREFSSTANALDWDIKSASNIRSKTDKITRELGTEVSSLNKMENFLSNTARKYAELDGDNKPNVKDIVASTVKVIRETINTWQDDDTYEATIMPVEDEWEHILPYIPPEYDEHTLINLLGATVGTTYPAVLPTDLPESQPTVQDPSNNTVASPSKSAWWDWFGAGVSKNELTHKEAIAYIGHGHAETDWGWGNAEIDASIGEAKAWWNLDFDFFGMGKDKKTYKNGDKKEDDDLTVLDLNMDAGVSVTGIAVDGSAEIGDDMLGAEIKGEGAIGIATAKGETHIGIGEIKVKDKDGNEKEVLGVQAIGKGKAMVAAAEGEAKATINILGIDITVSLGGYAGALGVEGEAGFVIAPGEEVKFVAHGGLAALLGVSAGIEIGINEAGFQAIHDTVEAVGDFANAAWDATTDFVEDAGEWLEDTWDATTDAVQDAWDATTDFVEDAWDATTDFIADTGEAVGDAIENAWTATTDFVDNAWDATTDFVDNAWDATTDFVDNAWESTTNFVEDAGEAVGNFLEDTGEAVGDFIGNTWNTITSWGW